MDGNNLDELRELVEFLKANEIAEFDMERPDLKVRLKFAGASAVVASAPAAGGLDLAQLAHLMAAGSGATQATSTSSGVPSPAAPALAGASAPVVAEADPLAGAHVVKSPIVGTFYDAPSPNAEPFVKVGDNVRSGQVLCIVEAMKLMNEIESDAAGEVVKVFAMTAQPVEYGQPLFAIKRA